MTGSPQQPPDEPEVVHARLGTYWRQNRCGELGGPATNDDLATCPRCRAEIDARRKDRPMDRDEHLKKIYITGVTKVGTRRVHTLLCGGPDCGGAQMFAGLTVADVLAEADDHIAKMAALMDRGDDG